MKVKIWKMRVVFYLMTAALFVFTFVNCSAGQEKASDFTLPGVEGERVSLSDFKGDVVILDFWATWCPPCVKEIPDFIKLYNNYKDKGLTIIGISLDRSGPEHVKAFKEDMGITYPIAMGDEKVTAAYGGIRGIPTTFIIDRDGTIVDRLVGLRPYEVFEDEIKDLL